MSEKKMKKVPVRDLKPTMDAKGGRHGHHHGHRHSGLKDSAGFDNAQRAGKYWL